MNINVHQVIKKNSKKGPTPLNAPQKMTSRNKRTRRGRKKKKGGRNNSQAANRVVVEQEH
jgi:hypothetical protein